MAETDTELVEKVQLMLQRSGRAAIRSLRVRACDGTVTLTGYVGSYHEKQLACQHVLGVSGVQRLRDFVEVVYA